MILEVDKGSSGHKSKSSTNQKHVASLLLTAVCTARALSLAASTTRIALTILAAALAAASLLGSRRQLDGRSRLRFDRFNSLLDLGTSKFTDVADQAFGFALGEDGRVGYHGSHDVRVHV